MIVVDFEVLDVGQGSANFVVVRDNNGPNEADWPVLTTFLFDIGSQAAGSPASKASVLTVVRTLMKMGATPHIAILALSHSDEDHISLLTSVLVHFRPVSAPPLPAGITDDRPVLTIDAIWYSSSATDYSGDIPELDEHSRPTLVNGAFVMTRGGLLPFAEKYLNVNAPATNHGSNAFHFSDTTYDAAAVTLRPFWPGAGKMGRTSVPLRAALLIANAEEKKSGHYPAENEKRPGSVARNRRSLVIVFRYAWSVAPGNFFDFVITGDATGATLAACNFIVPAPHAAQVFKVYHITAPHHGSLSGYNVSGAKRRLGTVTAEENFDNFVALMKAQTVSASAGFSYDHPDLRILNHFVPYLLKSPDGRDPRIADRASHLVTIHIDQGLLVLDDSVKKAKVDWPAKPEATSGAGAPPEPSDSLEGFYTVQAEKPIFTTQYAVKKETQRYLLPLELGGAVTEVNNPNLPDPSGVLWAFTVREDGSKNVGFRDPNAVMMAAAVGAELPAHRVIMSWDRTSAETLSGSGLAPGSRPIVRRRGPASFGKARSSEPIG